MTSSSGAELGTAGVVLLTEGQLASIIERAVEYAMRKLQALQPPRPLDAYVTTEEAGRLLGRSPKTVLRYVRLGRLAASKTASGSSPVLVERASIDALLRRTTA